MIPILPTLLTLSRLFLAPVIYLLVLNDTTPSLMKATFLFIFCSFTDLWDGKIARAYQLTTPIGAFLDQLADKVLVLCTLYSLYQKEVIAGTLFMLFLIRDVVMVILRMAPCVSPSSTTPTSWGKIKTALQFVGIGGILASRFLARQAIFQELGVLFHFLLYVSLVLSYYAAFITFLKIFKQLRRKGL